MRLRQQKAVFLDQSAHADAQRLRWTAQRLLSFDTWKAPPIKKNNGT